MSNSSWKCPYCHQDNHGIKEEDHLAVNPSCKRQHNQIQKIEAEFKNLTPKHQELLVLAIKKFKPKATKRSAKKRSAKKRSAKKRSAKK